MNAAAVKDYTVSEADQQVTASIKQGDIVDGIITDVSDMISIAFNDKEVKVPRSAVQNAKEGQIRKFEIKDISKNRIVLREVGTNTEGKASGVLQTNVLTGGKAFSGYIRDKSEVNVSVKNNKMLDQMKEIRTTLTPKDYKILKEVSGEPEETSSEQFERNLKRIKEQRQFTREHLEKQIKKLDAKRENVIRSAIGSAAGNLSGKVAKRLEEANLPVTKANIERVMSALDMASQAADLKDDSKAYLMEEGRGITAENLYKAAYSSNSFSTRKEAYLTEAQWQELQPKVEKLLQQENIPVEEFTLKSAKWLLSKGLPVTGQNMEKLGLLEELKSQYEPEQIIDLFIQGMKEGKAPEECDLYMAKKSLSTMEKAFITVNLLEGLTNEMAEQVPKDEVISLATIARYQKNPGQWKAEGKDSSREGKEAETNIPKGSLPEELKNVTARRQLEEIRQKLTYESCYRLYEQGIEVDTESLETIIKELKDREEAYYRDLFQSAGVEPKAEELSLLASTNQVVEQLKTMPEAILSTTFSYRTLVTLTGLYEAGEQSVFSNQNQTAQVAAYETLMTAPRKDLGDSIKKAFASVDPILTDLGLKCTQSNRQAVRILGYNSIEINKENIETMKSYYSQVENILKSLTPEVAVNLIKEGENPLDIPLTELEENLREIKKSLGATAEEKFSEYLYKLDQKKGLTPEERNAYIGVYRLLYQVEKSDGAAVGAVVKAGQELTLGNLLTAVRSKKKEGMDIAVTEDFGGIDVATSGNSISAQINAVYYGRHMTHQVYEHLEPELIDASYEEDTMESFMDLTVEGLYEESMNREATQTEGLSGYEEQRYEALLDQYGKTREATMLLHHGLKVTANQLEAANLLMAEGSSLYKQIKEEVDKVDENLGNEFIANYENIIDHLGSEHGVADALETLAGRMTEVLERAMEKEGVTADQINELRKYHNAVSLAGDLSRGNTFEIPVVLEDEVVNLKVRLIEGQHKNSNMKLQMSSPECGTINAFAVVQENSLSGYLVCENRQVADQLKMQEAELKQEIEELGIRTEQFTISMNRKTTEYYRTDISENPAKERPSNQTLYHLAKIFVKHVKQAMIQ